MLRPKVYDGDDGQPPEIAEEIGKQTKCAWYAEGMLLVVFTDERILEFKRVQSFMPGNIGLSVKGGNLRNMAQFTKDLDAYPGARRVSKIEGLMFSGLDGPVITFGDIGVRLASEGCVLMRKGKPGESVAEPNEQSGKNSKPN